MICTCNNINTIKHLCVSTAKFTKTWSWYEDFIFPNMLLAFYWHTSQNEVYSGINELEVNPSSLYSPRNAEGQHHPTASCLGLPLPRAQSAARAAVAHRATCTKCIPQHQESLWKHNLYSFFINLRVFCLLWWFEWPHCDLVHLLSAGDHFDPTDHHLLKWQQFQQPELLEGTLKQSALLSQPFQDLWVSSLKPCFSFKISLQNSTVREVHIKSCKLSKYYARHVLTDTEDVTKKTQVGCGNHK